MVPGKLERNMFLIYLLDWFYVPSHTLSRLSILSLYLRIFVIRLERKVCWVVMAYLVSNCVAWLISAQFECIPLAYAWDKSIKGGHCFNQDLWYELSTPPNIVADVAIMLLPSRTIWNLQVSSAQRSTITIVFLTGSMYVTCHCHRHCHLCDLHIANIGSGIIASCIRTGMFLHIFHTTDPTCKLPSSGLLFLLTGRRGLSKHSYLDSCRMWNVLLGCMSRWASTNPWTTA